MTVRRLLAECSSEDIAEWMAFYKLENDERDGRERAAKASAGATSRAKKALGK